MKKTYTYRVIAVAGLVAVALPAGVYAQTDEAREPATPPVRSGVQVRLQNAENNRDIRNAQLKREAMMRETKRRANIASSTVPAWISKVPGVRVRMASSTMASSTEGRREGMKEVRKEARIDHFARQHQNLVKQTSHSIDRLKDLREKIAERMLSAEQNGRTMTEAKDLLVIANTKITAAEQALAELVAYVPPAAATGEANASTTIALEKPRAIGKTAIEAVNEAQRALKAVVVAIAQSMGLNNNK